MKNSALALLPGHQLAAMLAVRDVSATEVLEAQLERIDAIDPELLAFIHVDEEGARRAAERADRRLGSTAARPLWGLTIAHKDVIDVRGMPTTGGTRLWASHEAPADAPVVRSLRRAGTVCLGKTNLVELATGDHGPYGTVRNPWHGAATAGASSSGAAAALAAGLTTLATGTDTGGSVRVPAAHCGIVGLRPTAGAVARDGVVPLSWSLDTVGPMARTVRDVADLLAAMADSAAYERGVPRFERGRPLAGVRIGRPTSFFTVGLHGAVRRAYDDALATFVELGAEVVQIALGSAAYASSASWVVAYVEAREAFRELLGGPITQATETLRRKMAVAEAFRATDWVTAAQVREVVVDDLRQAFATVDIIATPVTRAPASETLPDAVVREHTGWRTELASLTRPASLAGIPALALPMGWAPPGVPVGLQLLGPWGADHRVLAIGEAYEAATNWFDRRPREPLEQMVGAAGRPPVLEPQGENGGDALVSGVKEQLEAARDELGLPFEPAIRQPSHVSVLSHAVRRMSLTRPRPISERP